MRRSHLAILIGLSLLLVQLNGAPLAGATLPDREWQMDPADPRSGPVILEDLVLAVDMLATTAPTDLVPSNMSEDFEGAWPASGWALYDTSTADGGVYLWGKRTCNPRTGASAGWSVGGGAAGNGLGCAAHYPNNASTWAIYGPFSLRDAMSARLTFHMWGRVAPSGAPWPDGLYVGSSTNGTNFLLSGFLGDITGGNEGNGYHRHTMDLSGRLGEEEVWIGFAFLSDGGGTDIGMTVDDVTLESPGLPPSFSSGWASAESDKSNDVAWGDVDNDGDLDLAVGNGEFWGGQANSLYRNDGGVMSSNALWTSAETEPTQTVAWGDVDGDGDLDLAVGNACVMDDACYPNRIYRNDGGTLSSDSVWASTELDDTESLAWGDFDGDGDLDLAAGNRWQQPTRLYRNDGGTLAATAVWSSNELNYAQSVAWGDVDGDGDLDLAVGNFNLQPNRLYRNDGGLLTPDAVWQTTERDLTYSVVWGDVDGDGDLDLAVGNGSSGGFYLPGIPNRLYRNDGGTLTTSAVWSSSEADWTNSAAWGDVDSDGDLDLAVGNSDSTRVYRNDGGTLTSSAAWSSPETNYAEGIAFGDCDNDGDLDLAVANWEQPNRVYLNDGRGLTTRSSWASTEGEDTLSIAWGDSDGDGDLDLATGNRGPVRLHNNSGQTLNPNTQWRSSEADWSNSVAWGDVDGDGDLDLAAGNGGRLQGDSNRLYRNEGGALAARAVWSSADEEW
ncbi:MAG TPA: VCBS repeat-containing protein, partial [Anaerolineae bacterium]|nr:VCBS repeat-containing protein [Anaerolineae bacterium]